MKKINFTFHSLISITSLDKMEWILLIEGTSSGNVSTCYWVGKFVYTIMITQLFFMPVNLKYLNTMSKK
jgi:hypothetical protein